MRRFQPDPSRYEIERNVGEGLSASVFKAIRVDGQQRSRQPVALKFLKDRTAVDFLRREFETLSKIVSPHCARVLSWESSGDDCVLVLEWIDGPTLFDLAARFQLTPPVIDEVLAQIHRGLSDLHEAGLHHGDLHPRNVMIDSQGRVKLVDFASGSLCAGFIHGTRAYLAPEIWRGVPTSHQADLFALGVIERGLQQGFAALPTIAPAGDTGLTASDPESRLMFKKVRNSGRSELKDLVTAFNQLNQSCSTEVIQQLSKSASFNPSQPTKASRVASYFLAFATVCALTVPVRAEAPLLKAERPAAIAIHTQNWVEVSLNGRKLGYSPVIAKGLRPGKHRLSWKSAFGSGVFELQLNSGETHRVLDSSLRAHSKPGNR